MCAVKKTDALLSLSEYETLINLNSWEGTKQTAADVSWRLESKRWENTTGHIQTSCKVIRLLRNMCGVRFCWKHNNRRRLMTGHDYVLYNTTWMSENQILQQYQLGCLAVSSNSNHENILNFNYYAPIFSVSTDWMHKKPAGNKQNCKKRIKSIICYEATL